MGSLSGWSLLLSALRGKAVRIRGRLRKGAPAHTMPSLSLEEGANLRKVNPKGETV